MAETGDLSTLIDAGIPIVVIESADERRVLSLLLQLAINRGSAKPRKTENSSTIPRFCWPTSPASPDRPFTRCATFIPI